MEGNQLEHEKGKDMSMNHEAGQGEKMKEGQPKHKEDQGSLGFGHSSWRDA